jgi:hypothetical protein
LEQEGRALVIRLEKPLKVSRIEKDINKLVELYNEGYEIINKLGILRLSESRSKVYFDYAEREQLQRR